jgi:hypothetical protein
MTPPQYRLTGQGFKGEKILAVTAVVLTIVSTALLIHLTVLQRRHIKNQMEEAKRKKDHDEGTGK